MAEMTYENAMKRLEEIVSKLERETLSLDDSLKLFEEGTRLAAFCGKTLDLAEQKITTFNGNIENEQTDQPEPASAEYNGDTSDEFPF